MRRISEKFVLGPRIVLEKAPPHFEEIEEDIRHAVNIRGRHLLTYSLTH
jgi:hypothetical protein